MLSSLTELVTEEYPAAALIFLTRRAPKGLDTGFIAQRWSTNSEEDLTVSSHYKVVLDLFRQDPRIKLQKALEPESLGPVYAKHQVVGSNLFKKKVVGSNTEQHSTHEYDKRNCLIKTVLYELMVTFPLNKRELLTIAELGAVVKFKVP
jgi:hypothetical protein